MSAPVPSTEVRVCPVCGSPVPPRRGSGVPRLYDRPRCASVAYERRKRTPARAAAAAQRLTEAKAALGPRICAAPGCAVDISDRHPLAKTCSTRCRTRLSYWRRRRARRAERRAC